MKTNDKYGLVGGSLSHSFSKKYFSQKFENESIAADYLNYEINHIESIRDIFNDPTVKGLNVTIPYKEEVIPFLDDLDETAKMVGAVNTVQLKQGKLIGFNTDVFGFKQMIKPFFKSRHEKAMILGTGGASKAVAYVLENIGAEVIFVSRSPSAENQFSYDEMNNNMVDFCKIIVNTTPVGTYPRVNDCLDIPFDAITPNHLVIDLIYNPEKTVLLKEAEKRGAWILNGKTMLEQQAEKAWKIWSNGE